MLPGGLLAPGLAHEAELVLVSGYAAAQPDAAVRVVLDRCGARVLLVLASYEPVAWQLDVRPGTQLVGVVVSAYRELLLAGHGGAPAYRLALPCAATTGSTAYRDLVAALQARLGRGEPDVFRGYAALPGQIAVTACRRARGEVAAMQNDATNALASQWGLFRIGPSLTAQA